MKAFKGGSRNLFFLVIILCVTVAIPGGAFADDGFFSTSGSTIPPEQRGTPKNIRKRALPSRLYGLAVDPDKTLHLPPLDVDALIAEDKAAGTGKPLRAGVAREVNATPETHGEWFDVEGGRVWLIEIHSPSAGALSVFLGDVHLAEGAQIFIYSPSKPEKYDGPLTGGSKITSNIFWHTDRVVIELYMPRSRSYDSAKPPFKIDKISHFYRPMGQRSSSETSITTLAATCHLYAT